MRNLDNWEFHMSSIKSLSYLPSIKDKLEDDLASAAHKMFALIVDMATEEQALSLPKDSLITRLEVREGKIEDANFRKRLSQINKALTELELGLSLENTKSSVNLKFDEESLKQLAQQVTRAQLKSRGDEEYVDESRLVVSKASSAPPTAKLEPQVLVSYAWDANDTQLALQRNFAKRLEAALAAPPAKYQSLPSVKVFLDVSENGFQIGEPHLEQQNTACERSQVCVLLYTHKYLKSAACQKEVNYFLTDEGKNRSGKLTIAIPFSVAYGDMAERYKQNIAATPENYSTLLSLLENGTETDKNHYINKIAAAIFSQYQKHVNAPLVKTSHEQMRAALRNTPLDIEGSFCEISHAKENLAGQNADAIPIVDYMKNWALSTNEKSERLFYLLGDFGAGKSTNCQLLTKELLNEYENSSLPETERVLPIYLDLKKLLNAFARVESSLESPIENLIEEMLRKTGSDNIKGSEVVGFIRNNPSLIIFDGFDEVGQKLTESQQVGLLNKILDLVPREVYSADLKRLANPNHILLNASKFPLQTRILISCRTHFFNSVAKEQAFKKGFYRSEAGMLQGEIKNYSNYYLVPFTKEQIKSYLKNWLGDAKGERAAEFIETVHDLSGLSEQPIMLRLIKDLIPSLEEKAKHNQYINAATLYNVLFEQVGQRDAEKHLIGLDEKQKLLANFAVYLWQIKSVDLNREMLKDWFLSFKSQLPIMTSDIETGKYSIDLLLQDLHNACLLVRDGEDNYRFAHTSFYEYFLACGLFELVRKANTACNDGFDTWGAEGDLTLNHETMQFLLDWRQTTNPHYRKQFDKNWQLLQRQDGELFGRKIAFDIWFFAFASDQDFPLPISPNWSKFKIENVKFPAEKGEKLKLVSANFSDSNISESNFEGVSFTNANFSGATLRKNNFERCDFNDALFNNLSASANRFMACSARDDLWQYLKATTQETKLNLVMPTSEEDISLANSKLEFIKAIGTSSLAYSRDGYTLASVGHDQTIRLWDLTTQSCIANLQGHRSWVSSIAFSPDGKTFASSSQDSLIKLWDLCTHSCIVSLQGHDEGVNSIAFSPDGKTLASVGYDSFIKFWDVSTQSCIASIAIDGGWLNSIAFSPDGKKLVTGGQDRTIKLWDIETLAFIAIFDGYDDWVSTVSFSPNGQTFASVGDENVIKLWDMATHSCIVTLKGNGIGYHPDGNFFAFGGHNVGIKILNIAENKITSFDGYTSAGVLTYSPDGKAIASAGFGRDESIKIWDVATYNCVASLGGCSGWINSLAISPDGKTLVSAGFDHSVKLWDLGKQICIADFEEHDDCSSSIAYSPDGKTLVSAGYSQIKLWDMETLRCIAKLDGHIDWVRSVAFSPDGETFTSVGDDQTIKLWDLATQKCIVSLDGSGMAYKPDGKVIACIGNDRKIKLWDLSSQSYIASFNEIVIGVHSIAFSPDGKALASVGETHSISIWDLATQSCIAELEGASSWRSCISYSPDGKTLVSAGSEQEIQLWDISTYSCIATLRANDGYISSVLFDSNGGKIIVAGASGFSVWDLTTRTKIWSGVSFPDAFATITPDSSPIRLQGKAWKYFTSVAKQPDGSIYVAAPTSHPDWTKLFKL